MNIKPTNPPPWRESPDGLHETTSSKGNHVPADQQSQPTRTERDLPAEHAGLLEDVKAYRNLLANHRKSAAALREAARMNREFRDALLDSIVIYNREAIWRGQPTIDPIELERI
jgi:hypothetical protein